MSTVGLRENRVRGYRRRSCWTACALLAGSLWFAGCAPSSDTGVNRQGVNEDGSPIAVLASVDRSIATVGDKIRLVLEVEYDANLEIEPRQLPETLGDLEVVESGRTLLRQIRNRRGLIDWVVLRASSTGSYIIPELETTGRSGDGAEYSATSEELFIEITSVLPDGGATDIRGLKPLESSDPLTGWLIALAAVLVMGLLWWLRKRFTKHNGSAVELTAHERAFRDLEALRGTNFRELTQLRRYYFSLSRIIRRYFEERFGLNATDLTTEEMAAELSQTAFLSAPQKTRLLSFFEATDQVKYAAAVPVEAEIEQVYESALGFVEETAKTEGEPEEPEEGQGDDALQEANHRAEQHGPVLEVAKPNQFEEPSERAAIEGDQRFQP